MRVNVKFFSKYARWLFVTIEAMLSAILVVSFIAFFFTNSTFGFDGSKDWGIIFVSTLFIFILFNIVLYFICLIPKFSMIKNVRREINNGDYDAAKECIRSFCVKKRINIVNWLALFYLGYIEFLKDNVDEGMYYLLQINTEKINGYNAQICLIRTFLLYIANFIYFRDKRATEQIFSSFRKDKTLLMKYTVNCKVVSDATLESNNVISIIESLEQGDFWKAIQCFKGTNFVRIPFVQSFIAENR